MTDWVLWALAIVAGCVAGEVWFRFRKANEFVRGVTSGRLREAAEAGRQRSPFAENARVPRRRRSPDFQLVTRQPSESPDRPVFHKR
jgi:hypothetical protein